MLRKHAELTYLADIKKEAEAHKRGLLYNKLADLITEHSLAEVQFIMKVLEEDIEAPK